MQRSVLLSTLAAAASVARAQTAVFRPLGSLAGGTFYSAATAVSPDGSTVVGTSYDSSGPRPFVWRAYGSLSAIPLPAGATTGGATGVSADGTVVVGSGNTASTVLAFRWTAAQGSIALGSLPGGTAYSNGGGVSGDGDTAVGRSRSGCGDEAFRWTPQTGIVGIGGHLPGTTNCNGFAAATSHDGNVVVGFAPSGNAPGGAEAFIWTPVSGMQGLGTLPGGVAGSAATALSSDGAIVVGWARTATADREAFRWTSTTGMHSLGLHQGGAHSYADGVSDDGLIVVGYGESAQGDDALIWTPSEGMRRLQNVLVVRGVDLTGWRLQRAIAVSANGRVIVGWGRNPCGNTEGWVAWLDGTAPCYANCDGSTIQPILNVDDFTCFINAFAAGDEYANCDGSCIEPRLNVDDFTCFINAFAGGCP